MTGTHYRLELRYQGTVQETLDFFQTGADTLDYSVDYGSAVELSRGGAHH